MEVPIAQFRKKLFDFVNQTLEGKEVRVPHKGSRLRLVPERKRPKLSRITPMQIIVDGADIEFDSWKVDMMRDWERKWDRRLGPLVKPAREGASSGDTKARKDRSTK